VKRFLQVSGFSTLTITSQSFTPDLTDKSSAVAETGDRLATIDMGRKLGDCAPFLLGEGTEFPSNTIWPGPEPTSTPSFILIHPTVWPQYTNNTDRTRQDRQRSDSIGQTALQTVAQGKAACFTNPFQRRLLSSNIDVRANVAQRVARGQSLA